MATLVYSDVDGIDRSFSLGPEPIMVGRSTECAIRSDDPRVSRVHARFFVDDGTLWIEDLGSSNGIYVGPNKVQRSPVPTGEIVLVGSLMIRLLPASGTLPPPMGLHGTLAQWLEMERKARATVEEERDSFAKRVGELHEELRALRDGQGVHEQDASGLREELDKLRRASAADLEHARLEVAKAREAKMIAETQAGMTVAERLAESDMIISRLEHQLAMAQAAAREGADDGVAKDLADQLAAAVARADKADKDLASAQIRAQGAERNLAHATTQAAKAENRAADLEQKLGDLDTQRKALELDLAATREKIAALEARVGTGAAPVQATEARAANLAAELAEMTQQFETRRDRLVELEAAAAAAAAATSAAEARASAAKAEVAAQAEKLATAQLRASELEARLRDASGAEAEMTAARKEREENRVRAQTSDSRIAEVLAKAEESDKRASAADTMAKAMAKDVAEALRRAVEADARARAVARELDGAHRRAEAAENRDAEHQAKVDAAERRSADAEAKIVEIQRELGSKLEQAQHDLVAKADQTHGELTAKLDQALRELAAERSTAMSLVDRKTQLERDLSDMRAKLASVESAEARVAEYEILIETLEDRIQDLEANTAIEQTASQSSLDEARARTKQLENALAEARTAANTALHSAAELEQRVDAIVSELASTQQLRAAAEAALGEARARIGELERSSEEHAGTSQITRDQLEEAERRARDSEAKLEPFIAHAEAADLAIGRAGALQLQLDEALQKLSWLEREAASGKVEGAELEAAEARARHAEELARELEERTRDAEGRSEALEAMARDADTRAQEAQIQVAQLDSHAREVEAHAREIETRARDIEARAKDAAERIVDAEHRARDAAAHVVALQQQLEDGAHGGTETQPALERELSAAQARITELEREVERADNVRQFAANTEREIAQLERDLRDTKAKVTQITIERDRLTSQLNDLHEDSETTSRRSAAKHDPEVTAQADLSRYTALVARAAELEQKLIKMEKDDEKLRRQLAETEAQLAAQHRAREDEPTNTGHHLPVEFAEQLGVIEESIDSLRANMRAASDETATMEQSESVVAVSSAVSQAAEHVERARDAIRQLTKLVEH